MLLSIAFIILLMATTIIVSSNLSINGHEEAHAAIIKNCGGDSHIEINYFGKSTTYQDKPCINKEETQIATLGNDINEAIGYQLKPIFNGIMLLLFMCASIELLLFYQNYINRGGKP